MLYIAYGSNINIGQMAQRCPGARIAGPAQLQGYDLLFKGRRHDAVATVEPLKGGSVPVLLWEMSRNHERALDVYEGWPHVYHKEIKKVKFEGKSRPAMLYVMNEGRFFGDPSDAYYTRIRDGYKQAGFDISYLDQAVERSAQLALEQDLEWREEFAGFDEPDDIDFDDGLDYVNMRFW